jgi:hypothetical protein
MRCWTLPGVAAALVLAVASCPPGRSSIPPINLWARRRNRPLPFLKKAGIDQNLAGSSRSTIIFSTPAVPMCLWALLSASSCGHGAGLLQVPHALPPGAQRHGQDAAPGGFTPGKDYDIVIASIDPADTPADGAAEKARFLESLGKPDAASSVHFLTGPRPRLPTSPRPPASTTCGWPGRTERWISLPTPASS